MISKARAVFPRRMQDEMNVFVIFKTKVQSLADAEIHICAADFYQLWVNGDFVCFGPARTAKGYAREDIIPLGKFNRDGENEILICVAGYNCNSISTVKQQPFLMSEIVENCIPILWTGRDFECFVTEVKVQKAERYSTQRHFCEAWDFTKAQSCEKVSAEEIENAPEVIKRMAPYASYRDVLCKNAKSSGCLSFDKDAVPRKNFYSFQPSERWGHFEYNDIPYHSYEWVHSRLQREMCVNQELPIMLTENQYASFDFKRIQTGFIRFIAKALEDSHVIVAFSEASPEGKFGFTDMHTHNVVDIILPKGEKRDFLSFEPYVMRHAMICVKSGSIELGSFGIKTFENDVSKVCVPAINDKSLCDIYNGAIRTFAHNAVDIYMDCPSRERAGWLCDSYFTSKTEYALFGTTYVEDAFLENYRLYRNNGEYPKGVLPMCYPSEAQDNGLFIPQWTMWYILEVEEYINNRGHGGEQELFRKSINSLLEFYERYENEDGLLENLPSWNFIEWSRANEWGHDVNYPTNFLYAEVLERVYLIYGEEKYQRKSEQVRSQALTQSFNGELFLDHSIRNENKKLVIQDDCSEACQYYAILFGGIDISDPKYAKLKSKVIDDFGADKILSDKIEPINAFIGVYLRLEALLKMKEYALALEDVRNFFGGMEKLTGTLWEYREIHGSLNHGFASYAAVVIGTALKYLDDGKN